MAGGTIYTPDEDAMLRELYPVLGPAEVARRLGRTRESVRNRANLLGLVTRRFWTSQEEEQVKREYHTRAIHDLARDLHRSPASVAQKAVLLWIAKRYGKRPEWTAELEQRFRELHSAGYCDGEIAAEIGGDRPWISAHRRRLGLPSNRSHDRFRQKMRANVRNQCEAAGVRNFGQFKANRVRGLARAYGLPEGLRLREIQIVIILTNGPHTKREICEAIGMTWRPGRAAQKCLNSSSGKSYLSSLVHRGLIARVQVSGGRRPGVEQSRYLLTATAINLLATGGAHATTATD